MPTAFVPIIPVIPKSISRVSTGTVGAQRVSEEPPIPSVVENKNILVPTNETDGVQAENRDAKADSPIARGTPKLWTGLFKAPAIIPAPSVNGAQSNASNPPLISAFSQTNGEIFAEALRNFSATAKDVKLAFLEPRGLINTGNMCYMNSVSRAVKASSDFY
jgi:ubiquitin carboxyl-terminal hydrolase 10